jgi:hypothetical protein
MGGDPGRDFFTSPGDPLFYLHHGMIDRTWWIWQSLDKKTRYHRPWIRWRSAAEDGRPDEYDRRTNVLHISLRLGIWNAWMNMVPLHIDIHRCK